MSDIIIFILDHLLSTLFKTIHRYIDIGIASLISPQENVEFLMIVAAFKKHFRMKFTRIHKSVCRF